MADQSEQNGGGLEGALRRAPWWVVVLLQIGVPNFITLVAVGVITGLIPSPHLGDKFKAMEESHSAVRKALAENTAVQEEQTDVLKQIKVCLKHPELESCD